MIPGVNGCQGPATDAVYELAVNQQLHNNFMSDLLG